MNKIRALAVSLVFAGSFAASHKAAAASQTLQGITVSPAFQMVTIAPGASEQPVLFTITNNRPAAQDLSISVADFNTLNESGGLFFVGTNPTELQKKYGLAKWVSLPIDHLVVQPHQTANLRASILNLPDLQPGGHYGALMISLGGENTKAGQVGIHPIASSLLFVTKPEGATHKLALSDVYFKRSLFKLPGSVTLRFKNDGNTHVVPRGSVYINSPDGKAVSKGIINSDSQVILPQTFRQYKVKLNAIEKSNVAGKYKLHVDFRFDGLDQFRSYQQSFWQAPLWLLAGLAGLLIIIILLGLWKMRVRRNRRPKKISVQRL